MTRGGIVVAAALLAVLCGLYELRTFDTFFHLAAGRSILAQHAVPHVDPFSFTFRGAPWADHSWGFQVWLAQLFALGGFCAISLWQALSAVAAAALCGWSVRRDRRAWATAAVLAVLPAVAFREVLEARPHMLGFVCLSLSLCLVLPATRGGRLAGLCWLVPVLALWTTIHGSHVLLLPVLVLATGVLLVQRRLREAACVAGALTASLLVWGWLAPEALSQGGEHFSSSFLESNVAEWYPVTLSDLVGYWPGRAFLLLASLSLLGALSTLLCARSEPTDGSTAPRGARRFAWSLGRMRNERELYPVLLLVAFLLLALTSRRMLALFALGTGPVWLPFAIRGVRWLRACCGRWAERLPVHAIAAASVLALAWITLVTPSPFRLGAGLMAERFPVGAVEHLRTLQRVQRVYNAYNFGGYLMWQQVPSAGVFVDGRAITVYPAYFLEAFERAYENIGAFEALVDHYAVDGVLLPVSSLRTQRLRGYLAGSARWRLSYRDNVAVVYEATAR